MIRELEVVREPRGISWQNWAVTCKDTLIANGKYFLLALVFIGAAVGGTLYVKHASTANLARHGSQPSTAGQKVNLNTPPTALPSATDQAAAAKSTTGATATSTHASQTMPVTPACDVAAQTAANLRYSTNLALENTYHTTQLTLLGVTGTVGSLLGNPNSTQVKAENARHQNVLSSLQATLSTQLAAAHCTQ